MSAINRKWNIKQQDNNTVKMLCRNLNISDICARLLVNRGITDVEKAARFLEIPENLFHDPFLLPDMQKAVDRIKIAKENNEKICVYGDYDVDGVTSVTILYSYLKSLGCSVIYYVPSRTEEGYGLSLSAIDYLQGEGVSLIITVDLGVTALNETLYAFNLGIDIVITDHHECCEILPQAVAIVNPKRTDSVYPFKELAGVGVAFKLICALAGEENRKEVFSKYCELTALGTVADVMPLVEENRYIVSRGLENIANTKNVGLLALMECSGALNKKINTITIGYIIAPRLNAAGRVSCASNSVELLLCQDKKEAEILANRLCEYNIQRQTEENNIFMDAVKILENDNDLKTKNSIVLTSDCWHQGVIGIVASKLSARYMKPVVILSFDGDVGKGSGRSVKGINLYEAFEKNSRHLLKFGGHELAAGLCISKDNLQEFITDFESTIKKMMETAEIVETIDIDCELSKSNINIKTANDIKKLEPFGMANPVPLFRINDLVITEIQSLCENKHTKILVSGGIINTSIFCFGRQKANIEGCVGDSVDVVCSLDINTYKGNNFVQLVYRDMKYSSQQIEADNYADSLYDKYKQGIKLTKNDIYLIIPTREEFINIFKYIKEQKTDGKYIGIINEIAKTLRADNHGINLSKVNISLEVFCQTELISMNTIDGSTVITFNDNKTKVDLNSSPLLTKLKKAQIFLIYKIEAII